MRSPAIRERTAGAIGHFVCLDGFGQPSTEERAAGMAGHGEAHRLPCRTAKAEDADGALELVQSVSLPCVHGSLRRRIRVLPGENVVYVESAPGSLLDLDRPVNWAEHATIGSPFLERGVTVVDMSENRARTRPREGATRAGLTHRLVGGADFVWPMAPTRAGDTVDLRAAPEESNSLDHTGHRMSLDAQWAFVTALHPGRRLLLGHLFGPSEFPWLQAWEFCPNGRPMARGLAFGTQAFDLPRREVVTESRMFDTLLHRWLPARSSIHASSVMFWIQTPEGFERVSAVDWRDGAIRIEDHADRTVTLKAEGRR